SYMADVQAAGPGPGAHHVTNVALHALNVALLFWLLARATGAFWRSAAVAALFAVHPLHVESVAWITERKDVLSATFLLLTFAAYGWYRRAPSVPRYVAVAGAAALGLMAKPMLVTLPLMLLALDVWPLGRLAWRLDAKHAAAWRTAAREKAPLLALAVVAGVVTVIAQQKAGAVATIGNWPVATRVE